MAKRRANGEGTVYEDKNGVWWAKLPPDEAGKRPKRRVKTQREALAILQKLRKSREQGINPSSKAPTLEAHITTWLDTIIKPQRKPRTHETYAQFVRLYIVPELGRIRLDRLTTSRIQQWLGKLQERVSKQTARNAYQRLKTALNVAVKWNLISRNPAEGVDMPPMNRIPIRPLNAGQIQQFLSVAERGRNYALFVMAFSLGLRQGELIGLRWEDMDFEKRTVYVAEQVQRIKGKTLRVAAKSVRSQRELPLPAHLVPILEIHKANQEEERSIIGGKWKEHGLAFPSEVGTPLGSRNLVRQFKTILKKAGLPSSTRFHDCRHSAATLMLSRGVPIKTVSDIMGHSSIQVTADVYGYSFEDDKARALNTLASLIEKEAK